MPNTKFLKQTVSSSDTGTQIYDLEKNILVQCGFSSLTEYTFQNASLGIKAEIYGTGISFYLNDNSTIMAEARGSNNFIVTEGGDATGYYAYSAGNYILLSNLNDGVQCGIIKANENMFLCVDTTRTSYPVWTWDKDNDSRLGEGGYFFDKTKIDTLELDSDITWYQDAAGFAYLIPLKIRYGQYTANLNNFLFSKKNGNMINDILYMGYYIGHIARGVLEFELLGDNYIVFDKFVTPGPVHHALTLKLK